MATCSWTGLEHVELIIIFHFIDYFIPSILIYVYRPSILQTIRSTGDQMETSLFGIMHDNQHGFILGSPGILDGFIIRFVGELLKEDNWGMVGVPCCTLCAVDLVCSIFIAVAGGLVAVISAIFVLSVIWAVLPLLHSLLSPAWYIVPFLLFFT
jgi:hypothetical protein